MAQYLLLAHHSLLPHADDPAIAWAVLAATFAWLAVAAARRLRRL